jgi:hypothetical protein
MIDGLCFFTNRGNGAAIEKCYKKLRNNNGICNLKRSEEDAI